MVCACFVWRLINKGKGKGKRYSSAILQRPLGHQTVEASKFSRKSAHEGGKVFSRAHRSPLLRRGYPWYSFLLEAQSPCGSERCYRHFGEIHCLGVHC